jgi:hypothetical protein
MPRCGKGCAVYQEAGRPAKTGANLFHLDLGTGCLATRQSYLSHAYDHGGKESADSIIAEGGAYYHGSWTESPEASCSAMDRRPKFSGEKSSTVMGLPCWDRKLDQACGKIFLVEGNVAFQWRDVLLLEACKIE